MDPNGHVSTRTGMLRTKLRIPESQSQKERGSRRSQRERARAQCWISPVDAGAYELPPQLRAAIHVSMASANRTAVRPNGDRPAPCSPYPTAEPPIPAVLCFRCHRRTPRSEPSCSQGFGGV
eukprot:674693-Rhodomonas_salina.4